MACDKHVRLRAVGHVTYVCVYWCVSLSIGNPTLTIAAPRALQALPHEVRRVVSAELYERYERLLLQQALDEMNDIAYCPRPHCQVRAQ